ncbi:MAG: hypothetical protein R3B84_23890 [Zavarzinella sp.]
MNNSNHEDKKNELKYRHKQSEFVNFMIMQGLVAASADFSWLPMVQDDQMRRHLISEHRSVERQTFMSIIQVCQIVHEWIYQHDSPLICFIPNVGALLAEYSKFVDAIDFFSELINDVLLLSDLAMTSSIRAEEFDGMYYVSIVTP